MKPNNSKGYDVLFQSWRAARNTGDYDRADQLRTEFERLHGLTIFADGEMPVEDVTVRRMSAADWHAKYGKPEVAEALRRTDSQVKRLYPSCRPIPALVNNVAL